MISNKARLCIDILVALASAPHGLLMTTERLSKNVRISVSHTESLMKLLRTGGLVASVRGPGGGYVIRRDPQRITVWEVVSLAGTADEADASWQKRAGLTRQLEASIHAVAEAYLSTRTIAEFAKTGASFDAGPISVRHGVGLGPKPEILMPVAPNSVFQLSSFLQSALPDAPGQASAFKRRQHQPTLVD